MVDVTTSIIINRPVREVAAFAADPANAPQWYKNIRSVEWVTSPPVKVGSQIRFQARFLGRSLVYTYQVADVVEGERLVMRTAEGPFPMETTYTWTATDNAATLMELRNRGEPAGFSKLVAPLMGSAMRRANNGDLAALKRILETQADWSQ